MKKPFPLLFAVVLSLLSVNCYSQNLKIQAPPGYNYIYYGNEISSNTEGSPFVEDWKTADILLKNGKTIKNLMVRYNVYLNQMLYKDNGKTYIIGTPDSISKIIFPSKTLVYKEIKKDNKETKYFVEVLIVGKMSLFIKHEVELRLANYNIALSVGNKNDRLIPIDKLYFQHNEDPACQIKKDKILDAMNDHKKEIDSYIDKENLSLKKQEDLIKLFTYYNQL
jgi:regulatory protein YycH of two-component signal transduction system YycFG